MKNLSKLVVAVSAFTAFSAGAQTVYTGAADQERRDRNREEALANYRAGNSTTAMANTRTAHTADKTFTEKGYDATHAVGRGATKALDATKRATKTPTDAVVRAGHSTAEKARDVTDKTNAKFGGPTGQGKANPDGINPAGVSSASATAPSAGTTK